MISSETLTLQYKKQTLETDSRQIDFEDTSISAILNSMGI